MQPTHVIVRFGELTLKGRNRARFEQTVLNHVKSLLDGLDLTYESDFGRIYIGNVKDNYPRMKTELLKVFGIQSFSPVYAMPFDDIKGMQETALRLVEAQAPKPRTFKISVRRANKQFPHESYYMNDEIGSYVLDAIPDIKVDVNAPEIDVRVEIRSQYTYVFTEIVKGTGGFPLCSNGRGMLLLFGGVDSPVAGWYALRKGLSIEAVHFHSYPFTSERAKQKVIDLARKLSEYAGEIKLHLVPFTEIQTQLSAAHKGNFMVTFMRRAMYRISERLAEQNGALALITGESLGQVASQTLPSMNAIGRVVNMPILQPLVMLDKNEIIRVSEQIGTYDISILPYEDCCTLFLPKSPATNPNLRVLEHMENAFDFMPQAIEDAIAQTETMILRPQGQAQGHRQSADPFQHLF